MYFIYLLKESAWGVGLPLPSLLIILQSNNYTKFKKKSNQIESLLLGASRGGARDGPIGDPGGGRHDQGAAFERAARRRRHRRPRRDDGAAGTVVRWKKCST